MSAILHGRLAQRQILPQFIPRRASDRAYSTPFPSPWAVFFDDFLTNLLAKIDHTAQTGVVPTTEHHHQTRRRTALDKQGRRGGGALSSGGGAPSAGGGISKSFLSAVGGSLSGVNWNVDRTARGLRQPSGWNPKVLGAITCFKRGGIGRNPGMM